jgi:SAM-dependent methyltransferase
VLELGIGTGRIALPLSEHVEVTGIDNSAEMLALLAAKPGADRLRTYEGDMTGPLPEGPFGLCFVAVNTVFNLLTADRQAACFRAVAGVLAPGGSFVVEAFVPATDAMAPARGDVTVRSLSADRVVLAVSRSDPASQLAEGQYVEITEAGGVRLRPWAIRWATPDQLDAMADAAGFDLQVRHAGWNHEPFGPDSTHHVSVFRSRPQAPAPR